MRRATCGKPARRKSPVDLGRRSQIAGRKSSRPQAADLHDRDFEDDIQLQNTLKCRCSRLFTRDPAHYDATQIAVVPPSSFTVQ